MSNGATVIATSGLSRQLLRRQNKSRSDGGATRMEAKSGKGCWLSGAKSGVPVGAVAGLGKCESGWVKYEKEGERVGCELTLVFLVKYFTSFYTQSFSQRKIFYNFDYILHPIKHLKMGKYFIENILHQNKQSVREKMGKNQQC